MRKKVLLRRIEADDSAFFVHARDNSFYFHTHFFDKGKKEKN